MIMAHRCGSLLLLLLARVVSSYNQYTTVPRIRTTTTTTTSLYYNANELNAIEAQIRASARSQADVDRVLQLLDDDDNNDDEPSDLRYDNERLQQPSTTLQISTAAAITTLCGLLLTTHSAFLSVIAALLVFRACFDDNSLSGALARIVGRTTIDTVKSPKLRALARAVVTGEQEIHALQVQVQQLRDENEQLKLWQRQRKTMDRILPNVSLGDLKHMAREHQLPVSGSKPELLLRLIAAGVVRLEEL